MSQFQDNKELSDTFLYSKIIKNQLNKRSRDTKSNNDIDKLTENYHSSFGNNNKTKDAQFKLSNFIQKDINKLKSGNENP